MKVKMKYKKIVQTEINPNFMNISNKAPSYIAVNKKFLKTSDKLDFNLYFDKTPAHTSLFLQKNTIIDKNLKNKFNTIKQLYIDVAEKIAYEYFIEKYLQNIIQDEALSINEKAEIIYTYSEELTNLLYEDPYALENVQRSKKIVTPILESIFNNENTITSFIKIISYDYYTHTHSLNVSIYAICLGTELGLGKNDLIALGRAALLHDLGKSKIKRSITTKNGILSKYEFNQMKAHSSIGYNIAIKIGIDDKKILEGIRSHHEKLDGLGYPDNLKGNQISLFPRIIGVCDVFDALTTQRSYKDAMSSYKAFDLIKMEMNTHLDMKIVDIFIAMLHK